MARPKKDGVYINCYIQKDVKQKLNRTVRKLGKPTPLQLNESLVNFLMHKILIKKFTKNSFEITKNGADNM